MNIIAIMRESSFLSIQMPPNGCRSTTVDERNYARVENGKK